MKLLNKDQNKYKYKICKYMFYKQNKQKKKKKNSKLWLTSFLGIN